MYMEDFPKFLVMFVQRYFYPCLNKIGTKKTKNQNKNKNKTKIKQKQNKKNKNKQTKKHLFGDFSKIQFLTKNLVKFPS